MCCFFPPDACSWNEEDQIGHSRGDCKVEGGKKKVGNGLRTSDVTFFHCVKAVYFKVTSHLAIMNDVKREIWSCITFVVPQNRYILTLIILLSNDLKIKIQYLLM